MRASSISPRSTTQPKTSSSSGSAIVQTGITAFRRYRLIGLAPDPVRHPLLDDGAACRACAEIRLAAGPGLHDRDGRCRALWVGVFHAFGLYAPQHLPRVEEVRRTISAVGVGVVVVILLTFWLDVYLSRSWMAYTLIIALVLELTARGIVRLSVDHRQTRRSLKQRTLVIGNRRAGGRTDDGAGRAGIGFLALGYIDAKSPLISSADDVARRAGRASSSGVPRIRPRLRLRRVADHRRRADGRREQAARLEGIVVRIYTHLSGILASRLTVQTRGQGRRRAHAEADAGSPTSQRVVKRGMDLVLAAVGLIVVSPVLLVVALAIKGTSRGPVLFRQDRVTEGGRTFRMYKFRTMTDEAGPATEQDPIDRSAAFFKLKQRSSSDQGRQGGFAGGASTSCRSSSTCSSGT